MIFGQGRNLSLQFDKKSCVHQTTTKEHYELWKSVASYRRWRGIKGEKMETEKIEIAKMRREHCTFH